MLGRPTDSPGRWEVSPVTLRVVVVVVRATCLFARGRSERALGHVVGDEFVTSGPLRRIS